MTTALAITVAVTVLLTLGEFAIVRDPHHPPGLFAGFGVIACIALILAAKALAKAGLQRPEPRDD